MKTITPSMFHEEPAFASILISDRTDKSPKSSKKVARVSFESTSTKCNESKAKKIGDEGNISTTHFNCIVVQAIYVLIHFINR